MLIGYGVVLFYWLNDALTPNANNLQAQSLFFESMVFLSCGYVSGCALPLPELLFAQSQLISAELPFLVAQKLSLFSDTFFWPSFSNLSLGLRQQ